MIGSKGCVDKLKWVEESSVGLVEWDEGCEFDENWFEESMKSDAGVDISGNNKRRKNDDGDLTYEKIHKEWL